VWICCRCGDPLERVSLIRPLPTLLGLLGALGVALTVLPPRQAPLPGQLPLAPLAIPELPAALETAIAPPRGGLEGVEPLELMDQLAVADASWIPRAEQLGDGRIRYSYRRRRGDPELSLDEIRALIADPPRFERERATILELLAVLGQAGVRIQLTNPHKPGAAAEWDPRNRSLRVKPSVLESGSVELARVLNHEAIHVAQSCRNGGISAQPQPLGLSTNLKPALQEVLEEPIYRQASPLEQRLELEAYAAQEQLELGALLVRSHCRIDLG
jgi:hypothetical protein